nr:upf0481 protein [Quercus suber]
MGKFVIPTPTPSSHLRYETSMNMELETYKQDLSNAMLKLFDAEQKQGELDQKLVETQKQVAQLQSQVEEQCQQLAVLMPPISTAGRLAQILLSPPPTNLKSSFVSTAGQLPQSSSTAGPPSLRCFTATITDSTEFKSLYRQNISISVPSAHGCCCWKTFKALTGKGKPMDRHDANHVSKKELKGKELVIDIPPDLGPAQWPECCIYRVPKKLRRVNKYAYTPKLISIGPFHHGNEDLREMEMQKMRYFKDFCSKNSRSPEELASIVAEKELEIRHSYAEAPKQGKNQFVKMILLDAIFIIELVVRNYETPCFF